MPATTDELTYARSFIGTTETDATFNERVDRLSLVYDERADALDAAIEESMRAQLHSMVLDSPGQASAPGGISFSNGANMQTMAQELNEFRKSSTRGVRTGRLVRSRRR